jgi:hypothetical protein
VIEDIDSPIPIEELLTASNATVRHLASIMAERRKG